MCHHFRLAAAVFLTLLIGSVRADEVPAPIHGLTLDSIDNLSDTVESLRRFSRKATTRIVFDEGIPASNYTKAAAQIHKVSYVMGELLDSFFVKQYSVAQYRARAIEYVNALGNDVDIWEIGNEINGEWVGTEVPAKMRAGFEELDSRGKTTALTLYYNPDCWEKKENEMFTWAETHVTSAMKEGLDYIFVSYYEDDCNGYQPNWQDVFARLSKMFPKAKLGMGEAGTTKSNLKAQYVNRYYSMNIAVPNFVGGIFWWYYKQDGVPYTKPLWSVLNTAFERQPSGSGNSSGTPTPTPIPTAAPTLYPSAAPTPYPTAIPTKLPTSAPTLHPTAYPTWKYPKVVPPKPRPKDRTEGRRPFRKFRDLIAR